jgi:hypothetical protein
VALLLVFVNIAFFGVMWHIGGMVLSPGAAPLPAPVLASAGGPEIVAVPALGGPGFAEVGGTVSSSTVVARERSVWMIAGMLGCLFVVVALGVHLPGELTALLDSARQRLEAPAA